MGARRNRTRLACACLYDVGQLIAHKVQESVPRLSGRHSPVIADSDPRMFRVFRLIAMPFNQRCQIIACGVCTEPLMDLLNMGRGLKCLAYCFL